MKTFLFFSDQVDLVHLLAATISARGIAEDAHERRLREVLRSPRRVDGKL